MPGSAPVKVTVTNALGLSTEHAFHFTVGGDLSQDAQPPFDPWQFADLHNVTVDSNALWYVQPQTALDPERFVFPEDQQVSLTFVSESAVASHTLGWLYYDDLLARGYLNSRGTPDSADDTLVDANGNGIADFHEDLYNLAPLSGPQARPYIGTAPRCVRTFTSGGYAYNQPELAMNSACASTFAAGQFLEDSRPGRTHLPHQVDVIGAVPTTHPGTSGFTDRGLFHRIPNLLEPAAPANNHLGLGKLAFLHADDDMDRSTCRQMAPVLDQGDFPDGIPDYDVSAYDAQGLLRTYNPDPGITPQDRTVDLGLIKGGKEVVFFLVVYQDAFHDPAYGTVFPCLRKAADGRCTLHLRTPTSVHFSKSRLNLDQDSLGTAPTAERNMGCEYDESCNPAAPSGPAACTLAGSSQRLCGWLDADALWRLRDDGDGFPVPMERMVVRSTSHGNMAHTALGSPSNSPGRWLLAFEDMNGGGDRDFNDVVFLLQSHGGSGAGGGAVRSEVLTGHIPPPLADVCKVSRVRFTKQDDSTIMGGTAPMAAPRITYAVATDCGCAAAASAP